jgi:hypothetical protein
LPNVWWSPGSLGKGQGHRFGTRVTGRVIVYGQRSGLVDILVTRSSTELK